MIRPPTLPPAPRMLGIAATLAGAIGATMFASRLSAGEPKEMAWERTYLHAAQLIQQGQLRPAEEMAEELLRLAEETFGSRTLYVADSWALLGQIADAQNRHLRASQCYEQALDVLNELFLQQARQDDLIALLERLARCYRDQAQFERAAAAFERMLSLKESSSQNPLDLADSLTMVADFYLEAGRPKRAHELLQQLLKLQTAAFGADHPTAADTLVLLAQTSLLLQQPEEAARLLDRALGIQEQTLGLSHYKVVDTMVWMAKVREAQGKDQEAQVLYQRAELLHSAVGRVEQPKRPDTYVHTSRYYHAKEEAPDAAEAYAQRLKAGEESDPVSQDPPPADEPGRAVVDSSPAARRAPTPRTSDAELAKAVAARRPTPKPIGTAARSAGSKPAAAGFAGHPQETAERFSAMARSLDARATAYLSLGSYEEAETLFKWALEIYERRLGGLGHPDAKPLLEHYAELLRKTGRADEIQALMYGQPPAR